MKIETDITVIEKSVLVALIRSVINKAVDRYHLPDQNILLEIIREELERLKELRLISYHTVNAFVEMNLGKEEEKDERTT